MGIEIERKYLVNRMKWNMADKGNKHYYRQGYMLSSPDKTIRIRVTDTDGYITIKGKSTGASRAEYEYAIPKEDAVALLNQFCNSIIAKNRYKVIIDGKLWEVDEFLEDNAGLIIAEIELSDETESFELPEWIAEEVTGQQQYYNSWLAEHPFYSW